MSPGELSDIAVSYLPFTPTTDQFKLIKSLASFVVSRNPNEVFVLNGYAGTGKTSVMGAIIKAMDKANIKSVLLAPTGRAAKVASRFSSHFSSTIHKRLFRGNSLDPANSSFYLAENKDNDTVFIVDEASLIADGESARTSLLFQLISYVYSAKGSSLILVGDIAQLPPVGQLESYAMNSDRLRSLGLNPVAFSLTEPIRQASDSGILFNATIIRKTLFQPELVDSFKLFTKFPDVTVIESQDTMDSIAHSWKTVGREETLVITRSNFRANNINSTVRNIIMEAESPLRKGDMLVVSKNDYFWSKENKLKNFIANGESVEVVSVGKAHKMYGRWFVDVKLKSPDIEKIITAKIILRSLIAEGPSLPREEMERFYNRVLAKYEGALSQKIKGALEDPYYNAIQVKYGYCVTCHKAQGGQWRHVYIDMAGISPDSAGEDFFRWLYTAFTRATEKIYLIAPQFEIV